MSIKKKYIQKNVKRQCTRIGPLKKIQNDAISEQGQNISAPVGSSDGTVLLIGSGFSRMRDEYGIR